MKRFPDGKLVYSMWHGYLTEENKDDDICSFVALKPDFVEHHSGGHAPFAVIEELIQVLEPETVIPIHTTNPDALYKMDIKSKIVLNKGEVIPV